MVLYHTEYSVSEAYIRCGEGALPLHTGKTPPPHKKQISWVWHLNVSNGEAPIMEIWV